MVPTCQDAAASIVGNDLGMGTEGSAQAREGERPLRWAILPRGGQNAGEARRLAYSRWAHGVVVSHPLSMREALGSIPSVSTFAVGSVRLAFLQVCWPSMSAIVCGRGIACFAIARARGVQLCFVVFYSSLGN